MGKCIFTGQSYSSCTSLVPLSRLLCFCFPGVPPRYRRAGRPQEGCRSFTGYTASWEAFFFPSSREHPVLGFRKPPTTTPQRDMCANFSFCVFRSRVGRQRIHDSAKGSRRRRKHAMSRRRIGRRCTRNYQAAVSCVRWTLGPKPLRRRWRRPMCERSSTPGHSVIIPETD